MGRKHAGRTPGLPGGSQSSGPRPEGDTSGAWAPCVAVLRVRCPCPGQQLQARRQESSSHSAGTSVCDVPHVVPAALRVSTQRCV